MFDTCFLCTVQGEALVEKEQNGRKVVHQPPRDFSSLAPQEDSTPTAKAPRLEDKGEGNGLECAVDPSSGQEVLSGPNSPSSTPVPVVDGGANATVCLHMYMVECSICTFTLVILSVSAVV